MGSGMDGRCVASSLHDKARSGHRAGNDPEHTGSGGGSPFAVYDHFAALPDFLPGEVVVIFYDPQRFHAQFARYFGMDDFVAGGGIIAGQVHRGPIFGAFLFFQVQPGQVFVFLLEPAFADGNVRVAHCYFSTQGTGARVGKESQVVPWFHAEGGVFFCYPHDTEFHEMVS